MQKVTLLNYFILFFCNKLYGSNQDKSTSVQGAQINSLQLQNRHGGERRALSFSLHFTVTLAHRGARRLQKFPEKSFRIPYSKKTRGSRKGCGHFFLGRRVDVACYDFFLGQTHFAAIYSFLQLFSFQALQIRTKSPVFPVESNKIPRDVLLK